MTSAFVMAACGCPDSLLIPFAVSMKRCVMPVTCTSCSRNVEISGVGLYAYFSSGIASATSIMSVAARCQVATSSLTRLGEVLCAETEDAATATAATTPKNNRQAYVTLFMFASLSDSFGHVYANRHHATRAASIQGPRLRARHHPTLIRLPGDPAPRQAHRQGLCEPCCWSIRMSPLNCSVRMSPHGDMGDIHDEPKGSTARGAAQSRPGGK